MPLRRALAALALLVGSLVMVAAHAAGETPWGVLTFGLGNLSQHGNIFWFRHN